MIVNPFFKMWLILLREFLGFYSISNTCRWTIKVHNTDLVHPCAEEPRGNFLKGQEEDKSLSGINLAIFALERDTNFWSEDKRNVSSRKCEETR